MAVFIALLCSILANDPELIDVDQVVTNGAISHSLVASTLEGDQLVGGFWVEGDFSGFAQNSDQTMATTIQDPGNPDEPWVVTTYRRRGESIQAFIRRHRDIVESVRDALGRRYDPFARPVFHAITFQDA